jgi:hypothetical protein|tara:strand:- start:410 stop:580 length:171 start_codon:yes stop_codon:yes gene_type:complete
MADEENFQANPRDFAIELVEEGYPTKKAMLRACLKYMSNDDVRDMLDCNEWSPRFD